MIEFFEALHQLTFWQQLWVLFLLFLMFELIQWLVFHPITSRLNKIIDLLKENKDISRK